MEVTIRCANPDDVIVELSIRMAVGQMRQVHEIINAGSSYLNHWPTAAREMLSAIRGAIEQLEQRDVIASVPKPVE